jgi:hypothetical protein
MAEQPNASLAGWRAQPPNQPGVIFLPFNMSRTMYQSHPDRAYVIRSTDILVIVMVFLDSMVWQMPVGLFST